MCAEPTPPDHLVSDPDEKHIGEPCKDSTGYCRYADKCDGGEQHDGLCPGSANVKCCVPPGARAQSDNKHAFVLLKTLSAQCLCAYTHGLASLLF